MNEASLKRHERRRKQRELREQQKKQGKQYPPTFTLPKKLYIAMVYTKLDTERLRQLTESPGQLRLVLEENRKTSRLAA